MTLGSSCMMSSGQLGSDRPSLFFSSRRGTAPWSAPYHYVNQRHDGAPKDLLEPADAPERMRRGRRPSHCCPEKLNIQSHLAKHEGRSIAIVLAIVGAKQRRVSGDDRCWSMLAAPELWPFIVSAEKRLRSQLQVLLP